MKNSNTITTSQNIEVYENKIWLLVDEYINTVLCIHQEDYDSIEKYKKDIANVQNPDGSVRITRTTKVSGKGQLYFVNKFLGQETEKADGY